jgi:hypothetical protein
MSQFTLPSLPELMTWAAYVALGILAVFILGHAMSLALWFVRRGYRVWDRQAAVIAAELHRLEDTMYRLRDAIAAARDEDDQATCKEVCEQLHERIQSGPIDGLVPWLRKQWPRHDPILIESIERFVGPGGVGIPSPIALDEAADAALRPWWRSMQVRMNAGATAAPFCGAAPTMTGAQIFINDYCDAAAAASGQLPSFYGLSAALMTTAVGCFLAIAAVVTLASGFCAMNLSRRHLANAAGCVVAAYGHWKRVLERIDITAD